LDESRRWTKSFVGRMKNRY